MSTKIYNGYKIKAKNFEDAYNAVEALREQFLYLYNKKILTRKIRTCIQLLGTHLMNDYLSQKNKMENVMFLKDPEPVKNTAYTEPKFEDLHILFYPKNIRGEYLFNVYAPDCITDNLSKLCPSIIYYPYWDNTDRPDNVSTREWSKRAKDWATVVPGNSFTLAGLKMTVIENYYMIATLSYHNENIIKKVISEIPEDIEQELQEFKNKYVIKKIFEAKQSLSNKNNNELKNVFQEYNDIKERLKQNNLMVEELKLKQEVENYLSARIPSADLINYDFLTKTLKEAQELININYESKKLNSDIKNNIGNSKKKMKI